MRTLALSLLFLTVVPLASGSLKPELEADYWKDTGLDRAFASTLISSELCHRDERYYESCKRAILAGAELTGHAAQFAGVRASRFPKRLEIEFLVGRVLEGAGENLPEPMLLGKMISAQLREFDKYAQILPSSFLALLLNGDSKTYYDLGIETEISAAGLHVFHVHPNTPASSAGLRVNDRIVEVNGNRAGGLEGARFVANLWTGKRDFEVRMRVERNGGVFEILMRTAPVSIADYQVAQIQSGGKIYAHIRLLRFGRGSCDFVQSKIEYFRLMGARLGGIVLDVRHNGGGIVSEGQCIAQLFAGPRPALERAPVQVEFPEALEFPMGELPPIADLFGARKVFADLPLIVLVDAFSKSMAEVVAGSLQGYGRAWIVGERTYGKHSIQHGRQLPTNGKIRLLRTTAHFELPEAIARGEAGVVPDFLVPFARFASSERRTFLRETEGRLPAPARQDKDGLARCLGRDAATTPHRHSVRAQLGHSDEQLAFALALFGCAT